MLEMIDNIWTSLEFLTKNHKMNHKTFCKIIDIEYNECILGQQCEKKVLKK